MRNFEIIFNLENTISVLGIAWGIMGLVFTNTNSSKNSKAFKYSSLMILILMLPLIQTTIFPYLRRPIISLSFIIENHSTPLLFGPLFLLYTKKVLNNKINRTVFLHFIPFIIVSIIEYFTGILFPPRAMNPAVMIIHSVVDAASILIYGIIIIRKINNYSKIVVHNYSSTETDVTLSWLKYMAFAYIILFGSSFLLLFSTVLLGSRQHPGTSKLITLIPLSIFIFYFSYFASKQKVISINTDGKYERSGLGEDEICSLSKTLTEYMKETKAFLDPDLSLEKLSGNMNIPRQKISQALNMNMDMTFYSFVNSYRILEFEELVKNGKHKEQTMLGLAFECGFKSSSSFYNALKKERGKTPKQIIREISAA